MIFTDFADLFARIQDSVRPGDFCGDSFAQNDVEIILIIDDVEVEVEKLYNKFVSTDDEESVEMYRGLLFLYSSLRNDLDAVLMKLSSQSEIKAQKRVIISGLVGITNRLIAVTKRCMTRCQSSTCQSCGLLLIEEVSQVVRTYTDQGEEREELISIVAEYNQFNRDILKRKTLGTEIGGCDVEKERIWRKLK